jgi:hypothetical protein
MYRNLAICYDIWITYFQQFFQLIIWRYEKKGSKAYFDLVKKSLSIILLPLEVEDDL